MPRKIKKKTIKTLFGQIKNEKSEKEHYFAELCRIDDMLVKNALNSLHGRLTESEKEVALKWAMQYHVLLGDRED
tara:strand:+ start:101 stop:325 length:225 start_codon:yes stop_codon:yes gene_type:complete